MAVQEPSGPAHRVSGSQANPFAQTTNDSDDASVASTTDYSSVKVLEEGQVGPHCSLQEANMRFASEKKVFSKGPYNTASKAAPEHRKHLVQGIATAGPTRSSTGNDALAQLAAYTAAGASAAVSVFSVMFSGLYSVGLLAASVNTHNTSNARVEANESLKEKVDDKLTHDLIDETIEEHEIKRPEAVGLGVAGAGSTVATVGNILKVAGSAVAGSLLGAAAVVTGVGLAIYGIVQIREDMNKLAAENEKMPAIKQSAKERIEAEDAKRDEADEDVKAFNEEYVQFHKNYRKSLIAGIGTSTALTALSAIYGISNFVSLGITIPVTSALVGVAAFCRLNVMEPIMDRMQFNPIDNDWSRPYDMRSKETRVKDNVNLKKIIEMKAQSSDQIRARCNFFEKYFALPLVNFTSHFPVAKSSLDWTRKMMVAEKMDGLLNNDMRVNRDQRFSDFAKIELEQMRTISTAIGSMLGDQLALDANQFGTNQFDTNQVDTNQVDTNQADEQALEPEIAVDRSNDASRLTEVDHSAERFAYPSDEITIELEQDHELLDRQEVGDAPEEITVSSDETSVSTEDRETLAELRDKTKQRIEEMQQIAKLAEAYIQKIDSAEEPLSAKEVSAYLQETQRLFLSEFSDQFKEGQNQERFEQLTPKQLNRQMATTVNSLSKAASVLRHNLFKLQAVEDYARERYRAEI